MPGSQNDFWSLYYDESRRQIRKILSVSQASNYGTELDLKDATDEERFIGRQQSNLPVLLQLKTRLDKIQS
ncbi:hypothetical protein K5D38_17380 [Pseudomonas cichorii]|nr:hypothetical protein [Pseudomonas cichorii]